jgi:hypothetical protein
MSPPPHLLLLPPPASMPTPLSAFKCRESSAVIKMFQVSKANSDKKDNAVITHILVIIGFLVFGAVLFFFFFFFFFFTKNFYFL